MVGKKGNTKLLSEITKRPRKKRQPEKWAEENWATGKFSNET